MSELARLSTWLIEPMEKEVAAAVERLRRCEDVARVAVMPDVHLGKEVCIGVALATRRVLYPSAVGGDIGCGMLAIATDAEAEVLEDGERAGQVLRGLYVAVPGNRRHRSRTIAPSGELAEMELSHPALEGVRAKEVALQMGTLGGGNHFLELQRDEEGRMWMMIHSGSRGLGQAIREHHVARGARLGGGLVGLDAQSDAGKAYLQDVEVARAWARENRLAMMRGAGELLGKLFGVRLVEESLIHCDHNHVAAERHAGEELLVHRKGCMPAGLDVAGVLPGSMGTQSFHVAGRGNEDSMCSSAHGAGRALSRHAAKKAISARELGREMGGTWFDYRLAERLREEAPGAYKDIRAVVRAERELVRVTRTLWPMLSYKAP